jgi:hypothetical protein
MEGHRLFPPLNVFILAATKFEGAPRPSEEKKTRTNKHPTLFHSKRLVSSLIFFCEADSTSLLPTRDGCKGWHTWHSNKSPEFSMPQR